MNFEELLGKIGIKIKPSGPKKPRDPNKVTFQDAWTNFTKDLPTWGDQIKNITSWRQDKLIAFAVLVFGLILLIAGIIVAIF